MGIWRLVPVLWKGLERLLVIGLAAVVMARGAQAFAHRRTLGLLIVVGVVVVRAAVGVRMDQPAVAVAVAAQVTIGKLHDLQVSAI